MKGHRDSLLLEDAEVLAHDAYEGAQHILRVNAPRIAARARAGSFAHITCGPRLPMRRPLSIMRVDAHDGWLEFLYKVVGDGTGELSRRRVGEVVSVLGPIGRPFMASPERPRPLLLGGGVGIPPMVFLADELRTARRYRPLVIMGSEVPFPFRPWHSRLEVAGMPDGVDTGMPLLEDWGVPSRLASLQGYAGCHQGYVTDLARLWLDALDDAERGEVEIFGCGPHPMLEAVARVAAEYRLPCQVSLEEFMACAVGGCAGCTVEVLTDQGPAMKRVCVDGPVFEARAVFPDLFPGAGA